MKFLSLTGLVIAATSVVVVDSASASFASKVTRPTVKISTDPVLSIRGGGVLGTPVEPEHLVKLYGAFYLLNGAMALPAPEACVVDTFPELAKEGTAPYVIYEHVGADSLAYAMLILLSVFSSRSTAEALALSTIPAAYLTYKNALKGVTAKMGGPKWFGPFLSAWMIGGIYLILTGRPTDTMDLQIWASPPLVIGLVSELNPEVGMKLAGFDNGKSFSKATKAFFMWFSAIEAGWGVLAQLLLKGTDPMEAVGYVALLETLFMVDCNYVRKWNIGVCPAGVNNIFLAIPALTALGLLLK